METANPVAMGSLLPTARSGCLPTYLRGDTPVELPLIIIMCRAPFDEMTWKTITLLAFLAYWALCRFLRYRRFHQIQRRFEGREKESLSVQEAQWVVEQILQLEMCYLVRLSQAFALFRTYGIPTISRVLLKYGLPLICLLSHYAGMTEFRTTEFAKPDSGARRYADTGVLVSDFTTWPFDSERHARAVARVNFLHSHYPIKNDDMLYTLATAATNPQRWLEKYEWRPLTDLEVEVRLPMPSFLIGIPLNLLTARSFLLTN